ncbi:hypothetical protein MYX82_02945, partial [Acidobacteria bacterium AH-259-D05]|nr:hypothetical protein [Acidobacteria bacterium AH-259-D05]
MSRHRYLSFALLLLVGIMWPGPHLSILAYPSYHPGAQEGERSEPPNLILGTLARAPGTDVSIPLYYQSSAETPIRSLHLEVDFVSSGLKFVKVDKGAAAETQDYHLVVEAEELSADEEGRARTRLNIDVSVVDSDSGRFLPKGLWALLNFTIEHGVESSAISLNPSSISAQDLSGNPVEVVGEAGKV